MEILRRGRGEPKWKLKVDCKKCLSKLKINEFDVFLDTFGSSGIFHFFFICSVCKFEANFLAKTKIPQHIKERVTTPEKFQERQRKAVAQKEEERKEGVKSCSRQH